MAAIAASDNYRLLSPEVTTSSVLARVTDVSLELVDAIECRDIGLAAMPCGHNHKGWMENTLGLVATDDGDCPAVRVVVVGCLADCTRCPYVQVHCVGLRESEFIGGRTRRNAVRMPQTSRQAYPSACCRSAVLSTRKERHVKVAHKIGQ